MTTLLIQGDVMLKVVPRPTSLTTAPKGSEILALGEHSGHGHIVEGEFEILEHDGVRFIDVKSSAKLAHKILASGHKGDHDVIELPKLEDNFIYEVVIQNEFNPFSQHLQPVID